MQQRHYLCVVMLRFMKHVDSLSDHTHGISSTMLSLLSPSFLPACIAAVFLPRSPRLELSTTAARLLRQGGHQILRNGLPPGVTIPDEARSPD